jgi:excisionase family DNA binding protein
VNDYLSTSEAATALGVTRGKIIRWIYRGRLAALKRGWCWYVHVDAVRSMSLSLGRA